MLRYKIVITFSGLYIMDIVPDTLWHYTDLTTLAKIIQSKSLLATPFNYLNDSKEMKTGLELFSRWLHITKISKYMELKNDSGFVNALAFGMWPQIISLSDAKDSLSMWRGYSKIIDENEGVAIGFHTEDLTNLSGGQIFEKPKKCSYEDEAFFRKMNLLIDSLDERAPPFAILGDVNKLIPTAKNRHFREEREWRLNGWVMPVIDDKKMKSICGINRYPFMLNKLRPDGQSLTSFPLAIKEIMSGPKCDSNKIHGLVNEEFNCEKEFLPRISKSDIPFI